MSTKNQNFSENRGRCFRKIKKTLNVSNFKSFSSSGNEECHNERRCQNFIYYRHSGSRLSKILNHMTSRGLYLSLEKMLHDFLNRSLMIGFRRKVNTNFFAVRQAASTAPALLIFELFSVFCKTLLGDFLKNHAIWNVQKNTIGSCPRSPRFHKE